MRFFGKIIGFNQKYRLAAHLLFWLLLLVVQLSSANYYNAESEPFRDTLMAVSTNLLAQLPAAYFLTYWIVPRYIYRQKYLTAMVWFMLCAYVICVLSRLEVIHVEEPFFGKKANPNETYTEIFTDLPKLVYVYFFRIFSIAFIFMLCKLLKDQLAVQRRTLSLEKQKAEAELKLLKTQLNPHFLFNTLNNIYSLSLSQSPVTSTAIGRLSEILDYILYQCDSRVVPLAGEIRLLENYIGLERLRYDDRLTVNLVCRADPQPQIAPMLLLSIVENAFKHGAGNDIGKPVIDIELEADDQLFLFTVTNPFTPKRLLNTTSIGLPNLKQQLELIYPGKHNLVLKQTGTQFMVKLSIGLL